jgi:glycosyltransferase involved in cell wall biosynthesis
VTLTHKICFLSILHTFNDTRVFFKEARSLAFAGFDVTHLTAGQMPDFEDDGVMVRFYSPLSKNPILGRILNPWLLFIHALKINADCYHCNEIESWIVGCMIKLLRPQKKIIFDVHEHYPSFFENPFFPRWVSRIGSPLTLAIYRLLTPLTDYIVLVLPSLAKDFNKSNERMVVIANYASLQFSYLQREEINAGILAHFQSGKVAIHTGSIARSRGWPQLLQAISQMQYPEFTLILIGDIPNREEIMAEADHLGIAKRVKILPKVPYQEMMEYLYCADIGLILYLPDMQNHLLAWPTKFCDYMMAKLPVIAPESMERVAEAIKSDHSGLVVDPRKPDQIAQALDRLCFKEDESSQMGERGFRSVIEKYNWEVEAKKLVDMYVRLAQEIQSK